MQLHLYIHVPFCARRCSYCDFAIAVRRNTPDSEFVDRVTSEWQHRRSHHVVEAASELATIYFGGGTPSRLDPGSIAQIIETVALDLPPRADCEVTLEVNPDDVTSTAAQAWRRAGVNRISLGVQTHDPRALEWMHRTHRADQVTPSIDLLRAAGFDNISVDLIFALPQELNRDWRRDLELTLAHGPEHISLYGLTVEPRTPLARWTERGTAVPAGEDRYESDFVLASSDLQLAGYEHYEVSNAAQPERRSRHNSAYWSGVNYLGLGPSAHSLLDGVRSWNEREWVSFSARVARDGTAEAGRELLDQAQQALERLYLGLRTTAGVPADDLSPTERDSWVEQGWAVRAGGQIHLTPLGWLRLDALVTRARAS